MSKRPVRLLLDDIGDAIARIERYISGLSREAFLADDKTGDAVVRNLEIIGEAARRLPEDFTQSHPDIPWQKIVGLRHRIVHEYFGVDMKIVWQICRDDLSALKDQLAHL